MSEIKEIRAPIENHLKVFENTFRKSMKSSVPLLNIITRYILKSKGKQMRPMFVFLTADMCGGIQDSSYHAATLIELLHTATLIHDDVVDDSHIRRGFFSINALWKNKIAVLVGDYLLSKGLETGLENNEFELLKIVTNATREMAEGELLQIEKARKLDITEDIYFDIIRKKTASLIAACCAAGATSVKADKQVIEKIYEFGTLTGIAFQIKDDLFDYKNSKRIGKPNGIDIREKKMTLPLIYTLNGETESRRKKILNTVRNHNTDYEKVEEVIEMVKNFGGIEYAKEKMETYKDNAILLLNDFPDCSARTSLERLVQYSITRNK